MPEQRATVFGRIQKTRKFCNQNNTKQETQNNLRFLFFFCRAVRQTRFLDVSGGNFPFEEKQAVPGCRMRFIHCLTL